MLNTLREPLPEPNKFDLSALAKPATYEKAVLEIYERRQKKPTDTVECMFRPTEISQTKAGNWNEQSAASASTPAQTFTGGQPGKLTLNNLLFDSTHTGQDIRTTMNKLLEMPVQKSQGADPPLVRFMWGKFVSFYGNVASVTVKYTLFLPDGTPVRAETSLELREQLDPNKLPPQNPTSRSEARKTWVVVEGQTLPWIAYQEYGDAAHWRFIAETNRLADPLDLKPGQILKLLPLPVKR